MGRSDGKYLKNCDPMHFIMPFVYPNRCDNEAFSTIQIDLSKLDEFVKEKNAKNPDYKYTMFQCIVAGMMKTITLRSKLNRFIHDQRLYERNDVSASFVVKQEFQDNGNEVLCFIHSKPEWTIDDLHEEMKKQLLKLKDKEYVDETSDFMDKFNRLPKFISRPLVRFICFLEKHNMVPQSLIETDPYHASAILANLGSVGIDNGLHHLTNWGTTSIFVVVGESGRMPFFADDEISFRDGVKLGITVDERIADGFYFSKSIRILQIILEHPELLDRPFDEKLPDEFWQLMQVAH